MKIPPRTIDKGSLELGRRQFLALAATSLIGACSRGGEVFVPPHFIADPSTRLARSPQIAQVTDSSLLVGWRSKTALVGSIEYGDSPAYGQERSFALDTTEHLFALQNLTPDTRYYYRIKLDGEVESEGHVFDTAPAVPAPLRFAVLGDSGACSQAQFDVAAQILVHNPDLVLHTGDVIYDFGALEELDPTYFLPYRDLIDRIPIYACLGNHDVRTQNGLPLLSALYLPTNSATGSSRFYSFDRGEVHFVALDTNQDTAPGSIQNLWLEADLAAASATWTVAYLHFPPYSNAKQHGSDLDVRANLCPLLDRYGVDLVFSGHDHNYERTLPMLGGLVVDAGQDPDFIDPAGPIYVVTAGGGKDLYPNGTSDYTAYSESSFHFALIDVDGSDLTLTAVGAGGGILDRITITKSA